MRPNPASPLPRDEPPSLPTPPVPHPLRRTAQLAQAPHLPVPRRRRTTLPSPLPQLDALAPVHASAPPPARSGSVHRRRRTAISVIHASEPHPRTGDAALILSERPAPHPPPNGALPPSGAPPSSRRGFVLSRSGFLPPGRDPFCSAIPPVADPGTGAARGRLLANPCVSPHSTRHRSVLPSLFHETDPSSHRRRSSSACLRIR